MYDESPRMPGSLPQAVGTKASNVGPPPEGVRIAFADPSAPNRVPNPATERSRGLDSAVDGQSSNSVFSAGLRRTVVRFATRTCRPDPGPAGDWPEIDGEGGFEPPMD